MNQAGIDLLKSFEGFSPVAYPDPATGGDPWTLGFGFTKGVKPGDTITPDEAEERLKVEMAEFEGGVLKACARLPTPNQLAALVCFSYNVGLGAFKKSTLLKMFNIGDNERCADEFVKWVHAGGKIMPGLLRRRIAERNLFNDKAGV